MLGYIVFISILFFFYLSNFSSKYLLLVIIIFSILREGIGWDYYSYTEIVVQKIQGIESNDYTRFSFIWKMMVNLSSLLYFPKFIIIIPAIITHTLVYLSLKSIYNNDDFALKNSLLVYTLIPVFYLASFSTLRQWLAIALVFYSFTKLNQKKDIQYILLVFVASIIHPTALFALIAIPIKKWYLSTEILVSFFIIAFFAKNEIYDFALFIMKYFNFYNNYILFPDNKGSKILILNLIFSIYLLILRNRIIKQNPHFRLYLDLFLWGTILNLTCLPLGGVIARTFYYFLICLIVVIPITKSIYTKLSSKIILMSLSISLLVVFFMYLHLVKDIISY